MNLLRKLAALLVIPTLGLALSMGHASAQTIDLLYEEAHFSWATDGVAAVADSSASGGQAVKLTRNATGTITGFTPAISNIKVRAKSVNCSGRPNMRITMNGEVIANQAVTSDTWTDYNFIVDPPAGLNQLQISFTNEHVGWWFFTKVCERTLFVDSALITYTDGTTTPPPPPPPPPTGGVPAPGSEYVALGDSYSSGWGADRTPAGADPTATAYDDCGRNNKSGQVLLAAEWQLALVNASCGGANTSNFTTTGQKGEPPQLDRLTPNTKLVTATIGGNDTGLMWVLEVCVYGNSNCVPENTSGLWFSPANYISQMNGKINTLQPKIENILRTIVQRSPEATIRFAGYPYIIAPPGQSTGTCSSWLNAGEQAFFADAVERTNSKIRGAVEVVAAENPGRDIGYADPLAAGSPFAPQDNSCSSNPTRYMNGKDGKPGYWHPNVIGQQHYHSLYRASVPE